MTIIKERFSNFAVDDEGDVVPLEDTPYDEMPASNEFRTQGFANIEAWRRKRELAGEQARHVREKAIADAALQNAGVSVTLAEHHQNQLELVDIVSDLSMYRGGEKGGYKTIGFQGRYESQTFNVEAGARKNHKKLVNNDFPRVYKSEQLGEVGFSPYDIGDDLNQMRFELMSRYGGKDNKKARAEWRSQLKNNNFET